MCIYCICSVYTLFTPVWIWDAELKQARTLIAYAKNQMLGKEELDLLWKELDCFPALYRAYQQALRNARQMDYDDQMVYALRILRQVPEILH